MQLSSTKPPWAALFFLLFLGCPVTAHAALENWNEPVRGKIIHYVSEVTTAGSPHFIPAHDRIAAFDLDGTLITERPDYFHGFISKRWLLDKLAGDPALAADPVYKAVKNNDTKWLRDNLTQWILESFAGVELNALYAYSRKVFANLPPEKGGRPYAKMWYLPMVELIEYLKSKGFTVYIVSTAQQEIIRAVLTAQLNMDPAHIMGSMAAYDAGRKGKEVGTLTRVKRAWKPFCHGRGKVLRIRERVGRPPVFGVGNSTNDIAMLYYVSTSKYTSFNMVLNHDDPREKVYTKTKLLAIAAKEKWTVVSMKDHFKRVTGDLSFVKPVGYYSRPCHDAPSRQGPHKGHLFWVAFAGIAILFAGAVVLVVLRRRSPC